ncbi:hypothetical protein Q604_UNBC12257G0001 [human gut metagenome]|uniref:Uncharacterized protein n=1 Tax=human gut metagenome TaxID=408170 RepID=W1XT80_9ZZZZ
MADIGVYCAFILGGTMSYEVVARPLRVAVLTVSDTRTLVIDYSIYSILYFGKLV